MANLKQKIANLEGRPVRLAVGDVTMFAAPAEGIERDFFDLKILNFNPNRASNGFDIGVQTRKFDR